MANRLRNEFTMTLLRLSARPQAKKLLKYMKVLRLHAVIQVTSHEKLKNTFGLIMRHITSIMHEDNFVHVPLCAAMSCFRWHASRKGDQ